MNAHTPKKRDKQRAPVRNIGGTLSGDPRDIAALTPEQIKALPVEGMPPTAPSVPAKEQ